MTERADRKVATVGQLLADRGANGRVLVVGCGSGREAGQIARDLGCEVVGIDVVAGDRDVALPATLAVMDGQRLAFRDETFEVVYSFHALEHIPDPRQALLEMSRVLRPGGQFLIGTPNKQRLVGYVGSSAALMDRVRWNVADWKARARGAWSNEQGAHAGFSGRELVQLCGSAFGTAEDVSNEYYLALYSRFRWVVDGLIRSRACRWTFPAVYVVGHRNETTAR